MEDMEDFFIKEFYDKMRHVNLDVIGIIDADDKIHTLGTDSKIIGRVFEILVQPVLSEIAKAHGLILETPASQTIYPDFILIDRNAPKKKIAIDVKTTYISRTGSTIKFTLGSYGSYMRNGTKNIAYQYTDFVKHYVIGFVYKRNDAAQESRVYPFEAREKVLPPYHDVEYFIQEKYKIAGDKPGSGNTENIGSFATTSILDLTNGSGPFSMLGEDVFELYWKHYPKFRGSKKPYTSLREFFDWFRAQDPAPSLLHPYDCDAVMKRILKYRKSFKC